MILLWSLLVLTGPDQSKVQCDFSSLERDYATVWLTAVETYWATQTTFTRGITSSAGFGIVMRFVEQKTLNNVNLIF